jgi:hypothetical protein
LALKKVLVLENLPSGRYMESRVDIADGDFISSGNLLERTNTQLVALEEYKRVRVARVVDNSRHYIESGAHSVLLRSRAKPNTI